MSLDSNPFENPWDVGGKHHQQLPWVQDARRYGFDQSNDFYTPKSREEIRNEGLLQLAVVAVVVAAPAIIGTVSGGVGAASSGQAAGVAAGQASTVSGGLAANGALAKGITSLALSAFLQADASQQILAQVRQGPVALNRFFHAIAPIPGQSVPNRFEWQPEPQHPSMKLLEDLIGDPVAVQTLRQTSRLIHTRIPETLVKQVAAALQQISHDPMASVVMVPMVLQTPASVTGGPPDSIIDENGKVTPLMRMFMQAAFNFSSESIDETLHKAIGPGWLPDGREVIAKEAFRGSANAITLGKQVIYNDDYWFAGKDIAEWITIVVHEHTHRQEIWEYNDLGWYAAYLVESVTTAYRDLTFEKRAYKNDAEARKFLNSADGKHFLTVLQDPIIPENEKGFWVTYHALKSIREPHLQKEIKNSKNDIFKLEQTIKAIASNGEAIPDILNSKLDQLKLHLDKVQLELTQVQKDIEQLGYLGYNK